MIHELSRGRGDLLRYVAAAVVCRQAAPGRCVDDSACSDNQGDSVERKTSLRHAS